jgi:hypothetical protein
MGRAPVRHGPQHVQMTARQVTAGEGVGQDRERPQPHAEPVIIGDHFGIHGRLGCDI